MASYKAFVVNLDGVYEGLVAETSQKKAAAALNTTLCNLKNYGYRAFNKQEVEIAITTPGKVFIRKIGANNQWQPRE